MSKEPKKYWHAKRGFINSKGNIIIIFTWQLNYRIVYNRVAYEKQRKDTGIDI